MSQTDTDTTPAEFVHDESQADEIRQGLAEMLAAGQLMGRHEEESE